MFRNERLFFVVPAMLALIAGLLAGLQRIGWKIQSGEICTDHGAIMIGGFLGTLIILEKIIPLKKKILFVLPVISAGSVILFSVGMGYDAVACLVIASAGLSIVFFIYWFRERSLPYFLMFVGSACWLIGNILLLETKFYPISISWWMAFVLLIITAERLELTKFLPVSKTQKLLCIGMLAIFTVACILSFHGIGNYLAAIPLVGVSLWLMRHDVVGINLRRDGLPKFVGIALLSGYCALLLAGILLPSLMDAPLGYDIIVHCFFIGFTFSMIFAHGPIILPGVLAISVKPYHPILYFWLTMLHTSWIMRMFADVTLNMQLRMYTGMVSAITIIGYFVSIAVLSVRSYRAPAI